jgi:hypothetical protein
MTPAEKALIRLVMKRIRLRLFCFFVDCRAVLWYRPIRAVRRVVKERRGK